MQTLAVNDEEAVSDYGADGLGVSSSPEGRDWGLRPLKKSGSSSGAE